MRAIILQKPGVLELADVPLPPDPGSGEALVRVHSVGVCGTDFHAYRGKQPFFTYPRILGHEVSVEVMGLGADVTGVKVGDRCAVEPYLNCGNCIACRLGKPNCCTSLSVLGVHADGAMRDHYIVPARKLHPSATLSYDELAIVETLGIGAHAVVRAALSPRDTVLIIGTGPIGLSTLQFVQAAGVSAVAVMDVNEERLRFCREQCGVKKTLSPGGSVDETDARVKANFGGDLPTVVFDATGNASSMNAAFRLPCHGGKLVFVGLHPGDVTFADPEFHKRELTLLSSRNSTHDDFRRIIAAVEAKKIATRLWITHDATVDNAIDRFKTWMEPDARCLKGIIRFA